MFDNLYTSFRDLALRPDYCPTTLYKEIQRAWETSINYNSIRTFFAGQGLVPFEHELIEVLRRLDKDDDGTINYYEFDEFLLLCDSAFARPVGMKRRSSSRGVVRARENYLSGSPRRTSPYKSQISSSIKKSTLLNYSTVASSGIRNSPTRAYGSTRDFSRSRMHNSKLRKSRENLKYASYVSKPRKTLSMRDAVDMQSTSKFSTISRTTRVWSLKSELTAYFRSSTRLENDVDLLKQELCLRSDYNALDHFRLIDVLGKGQVRQDEFSAFLITLDPSFTASRSSAIFRRLDTDTDGLISFSDFLNAIVPLDDQYESLINSRTPSNHLNEYTLLQLFSFRTRECMKGLFHMIADAEIQLRDLRVAMPETRDDLFEVLDISRSGELSKHQLRRFCELNDLTLSINEMELLFRRLDKNEDGLLTFNDFIKEMGI